LVDGCILENFLCRVACIFKLLR